MTITPPLWGVILGLAVVIVWLFPKAMKEDARNALIDAVQQEIDERRAKKLHSHVPTQDIDTDYANGGD